VIISFFTYSNYFQSNNIKVENPIVKIVEKNKINDKEKKDSENIIKNLKYISKDPLGNEYIIESEFGNMDLQNKDVIYMENVQAKITMLNSDPIFVHSGFAKYNNKNYETNFYDEVKINYLNHKIESEKFYISIENNIANISNNVFYTDSETKLMADIIEFDLVTKNSKILMIDEKRKIKITNR
tara:strand:+ start:98 stop:649 length:552 start_codon:yes stop_codon:yes gene_type:complete